jgi:hypothetical protein
MNAFAAAPVDGVSQPGAPSWSERNQQWLTQQMARLAQLVEGGDAGKATATAVRRDAEPFTPALAHLADLFGLSPFEQDVLLLAAGVELDAALRRAVTAQQGLPRPSFALALARLPDAHWDALSPRGPLRYWRLLSLEPGAPLTEAALRVDERVLHHLTGVPSEEEALCGIARRLGVSSDPPSLPPAWIERLAAALAPEGTPPVIAIDRSQHSLAADARLVVVASLARLGFETLFVCAHDLPADSRELAGMARTLDREAALSRAIPVVDLEAVCDNKQDHEVRATGLIAALRGAVLLLGEPSRDLLMALPERCAVRLQAPALPPVAASSEAADRALRRATRQFRLGAAALETALASLDIGDADEAALDQAVWSALREAARGGLDGLAQRIESRTCFQDLVLPQAQLGTLRDIARHLRHRQQVYADWGFAHAGSRGLGLCALFAGESGTGKTMAAEAIANESALDLFRVDLAMTVSKYIGETEKNLKHVFDAAEASGAVLLFDEADALFGKRNDVKDSHDRYANIEVAYLLQRIEAYRGLAILTTNMKSALDRAFLRRIRFIVQFPFPDAAAREELWRRQFPPSAPVGVIDARALSRLQVAGGSIRSIALNAAFKAADLGCPIDQDLLLDAARTEFAKLERGFTEV